MKKSKWIFLVFIFVIGILAVQSVWGEGQIQKRKIFIQKPKLVQVRRWITLWAPQKQISGVIKIAINGNPLSNWKVKAAGLGMSYSAPYYKLGKKPFSLQSGKTLKVIMTPPPGFWPKNPRVSILGGTNTSSPIVATARICRIGKFTYPANKARIRLGSIIGNLTVRWTNNAPTHSFRLYERLPGGSYKKLMEKEGVGTSVTIPKSRLKRNKLYKMTLVQVCGSFKFNRKMAPNSFLDLMLMIDSYFFIY